MTQANSQTKPTENKEGSSCSMDKTSKNASEKTCTGEAKSGDCNKK